MQTITTIGLDIAKSVFQVHGVDAEGHVLLRRQLKRRYVLVFFQKLPPCLVGIEACASSHHWSLELRALGHTVRLMPPAYVKPYYSASRSVTLLITVLCCIGFRSREAIAALALVMSVVQGFDGLIGDLAHDPAKTFGPFVFVFVNFAALVWLLRSQEECHTEENSNRGSLSRGIGDAGGVDLGRICNDPVGECSDRI
jgi:hypothetical protein